jgi:N-acetylglutamate synthase-like GNAT family acetyltransferase
MWPNKPMDYIKIEGDESALHFGIEVEGVICSVVSLFIEKDQAQIRKLATLVDYQNRSYATNLMTHCIEHSKKLQLKSIWLNARADKIGFYKRFGFTSTNTTFEKGCINYVVMSLKLL